MSGPASPCLGCENREIGCHGSCERYQAWRQDLSERTAAENKERRRAALVRQLPERAIKAWHYNLRRTR